MKVSNTAAYEGSTLPAADDLAAIESRYASKWPQPSTPPVENSNPERVAPQGADGQGVCTIDTCALGDLWLPAYVQELRELVLADKLHRSAHRRKVKDTLSYTGLYCHAQRALGETVEHIRKRGGLLLIGGVQ